MATLQIGSEGHEVLELQRQLREGVSAQALWMASLEAGRKRLYSRFKEAKDCSPTASPVHALRQLWGRWECRRRPV
jgi:hypothetical protein